MRGAFFHFLTTHSLVFFIVDFLVKVTHYFGLLVFICLVAYQIFYRHLPQVGRTWGIPLVRMRGIQRLDEDWTRCKYICCQYCETRSIDTQNLLCVVLFLYFAFNCVVVLIVARPTITKSFRNILIIKVLS